MKVLIIQQRMGIGDMVIYLPYIRAISKKHDNAVTILAKKNSKVDELLKEDTCVEDIIFLEREKNKNSAHNGISGFFKLANLLKSKKFDKVYIFNSSLRYLLLVKFAGIKRISQYPLFRKKDNIVISAKIFTENELGVIVSTQPILNLKNEKSNDFKNKMNKDFKHICLGISASGPTKRWDVENYINLCKKINATIPCKFYLAGGKNDQELIDKILSSSIGPNCISFSDLKIIDTLPAIKNCNLYLGNDTGFLHIACALEIKCLALFMDSPVMAYGKYSKYISVIVPEGETEESTTHNTLGKNKISFKSVYTKALTLLS
jgi:heptosyltransferase-2|tara:strand:- start:566 stop:1522 length:957 start_codon:yes stop_codon:yes gene_type:complete